MTEFKPGYNPLGLDLNEEPKLFWVREPFTRRPVAAVAYKVVEDKFIAFSLSIQNPKDTFDKTLGRKIAFNRFAQGKHFVISGDIDPKKAMAIILGYLGSSPFFPKHLRLVATEMGYYMAPTIIVPYLGGSAL